MNYSIEQIERYLAGELPAKERASFEEQMAADPELSEAVDRVKDSLQIIDIAGAHDLRQELRSIHEEIEHEKKGTNPWRYLLPLAASIILVCLAYIGFWPTDKADHQTFFATYHEVYRSPMNLRQDNPAFNRIWQEAIQAYDEGDYPAALPKFREISNAGKGMSYLGSFYAGQCLLSMDSSSAAVVAFQKVLQTDNDYREQARWYVALCYLKQGKPEALRTSLEAITEDPEAYRYKEALQLLRKI